ncbi:MULTISPECIES: SH3 domain-containing protein [unclassified Serratia (in: enterobacteria)]|uniref:SH3 domain-containing protein n=1 Tax=unclassified Serratia (in: enterobacteria) TaxID=2647522 RepID=UPI003076492A
MTDNNRPEQSQPDEHSQVQRTLANLKSVSQLAALNGLTNTPKLVDSINTSILPRHIFPESILRNYFRYETALKTASSSTSFMALYRIQRQTDFSKTLSAISETPFFKVMEKFSTVTDLYQSPAMKNIYAPSAITIAGDKMKKDVELLKSMAKGAGINPHLISDHIAAHELLNQSHRSLFDSQWEKLSQRSVGAISLKDQVRALEAINKLFSEDRNSFIHLRESIIDSLENQPEEEVAEVREQVRSARKFSDLPSSFKLIFMFLLAHFILEPVNEIKNEIIMNYIKLQCVTQFLCENKKEQVKILTVNRPDDLTYQDLNRIRVVRRNNVRLRTGPSMQAEVIEVLPMNLPLVVINRDNRIWLLVRTELNGEEIEGWVNRSYTKVLIK